MNCRFQLVGLAALALSACASPAKVENMVASATVGAQAPNSDLVEAACVTKVTGGEETNPLWTSESPTQKFN